MSRLGDASVCPDCRTPLVAPSTCPSCGLVLTGADAQQLWVHMSAADQLVDRIRATAGAATVPVAGPSAPTPVPRGLTAGLPAAPPLRPAPVVAAPLLRPRVSGLSVQVVLLGVGGLCLLVAATVFIAVRWGDLGLAGRTIVLAGVTTLIGAIAVSLTRRGLRGGAETLWLLTAALVTIDLVAAWAAGMLDDLADRQVVGLIGLVLLLASAAVELWVASTPLRRLVSPVLVAIPGIALAAGAEVWFAPHATEISAVAVPVLAGGGLLLSRWSDRRLAWHATVIAGAALVTWCVLALRGLDRAAGVSAGEWWQHLLGWPLLVAAVWAGATAGVRRLREPLRYLASTASLGCLLAVAVAGDASDEQTTVVLCGVSVALAAVSATAPRVWSRPAGAMTLAAFVTTLFATALRPLGVIVAVPTTARPDHADLGRHLAGSDWAVAPWTAVVLAAVAALSAPGLLRHLPPHRRAEAIALWRTLAPVVVALGLVTVLLEHRPSLVVAVSAWAGLLALAAVLTGVHRRTDAPLVAGLVAVALLALGGLRLAVPSHLLVAVLATTIALVLAVAASRVATERLSGALGPLLSSPAVLVAGFSAAHWSYVAGGRGNTAGLVLVLLMTAVGIGAPRLGRTEPARIAIEVSAVVGSLVAPFLPTQQGTAAVVVTIAGSGVAVVSILHRDRELFSWLATGLLLIATAVRLDAGTSAPEVLALPAAAVLLAAGTWRLRHDAKATSWRVLGSGLGLGLVPSLLLALDDPVSLRGVLVGVAGLGVLALGIAQRWAAPFLAGAAVVAVLAVRHLGPLAAGLPRWISLGSVGLVLLLVGITWEARRRDAVTAERYLTALR